VANYRKYSYWFLTVAKLAVLATLIINVSCQRRRAPGSSGLTPEEAREIWERYGAYFPVDVALDEWTRASDFEYAEGEDVAGLIGANGDAYEAYGCAEVIRVTYAHKSDTNKDITATAADMGGLDAAYGIFTYFRPENAETWDGGDDAERGETYIAFVTGRYYVRVETERDFFGAGAAMDELAVGLAVRLPKAGKIPVVVNLLPGADLNVSSIKFGKGPVVLLSLRPDLEPYVGTFVEESEAFVIGRYGGARLMIVEWDPDEDAAKRFNRVVEETGAKPAGELHEGDIKVFKRFADNRPILLCLNGNFILEVFDYENESYAREILGDATGPVVRVSGATINFL
jgi:hypothetical protein